MSIDNRERPVLDGKISVQDFKEFYWLKEELQDFCREIGLSTSGGKIEISGRIVKYLETGSIERPSSSIRAGGFPKAPSGYGKMNQFGALSLETIITPNFRCSEEHRKFFKSVIGAHFHFSTFFQNWCKQNVGKTYQDAVNAWYEEEERKKDKNYKTQIAPQFEYNQFIRDFFNDPQNKGKNKMEAIAAWKEKRSQRGDNKYVSAEN